MGSLNRRQKKMANSAQVEEICESIVKEGADEETKCKMILESIDILVRRGNRKQAGEVVDQLDKKGKLPKNVCRDIMMCRETTTGKLVSDDCVYVAAEVTVREALASDETAKSTLYDWLQAKSVKDIMSSITRRQADGKKLMKVLLEERPKIVFHIIQQRGVRDDTLALLLAVASDDPNPTISETVSDIVENCVHSERWIEKGNKILEIASAVNSVDRFEDTVCVDTAYLMNWGEKNGYFHHSGSTEIQNLIGEMAEKKIVGRPDLERLQDIVKRNRAVDLLMFLPHKRYRGHDIHQFNVATLGLFFLDTCLRNGQLLRDYVARVHKLSDSDEVDKAWLMASFLHDHALPISHMFRIAPLIYAIKRDKSRSSYGDAVTALQKALVLTYDDLFSDPVRHVYRKFVIASEYGSAALEKLISKEMSKIGFQRQVAKNELDHGVLAAANIASIFDSSPIDLTVQTSARAIAVHSLMTEKISFKEDPLSFLLVLCDELQEWGREIAIFPEILIETSSMRIGKFCCDGSKRRLLTDNLTVSFRFFSNLEGLTKFNPSLFKGQKETLFSRRLDFDDPDNFPPIHIGESTFGI